MASSRYNDTAMLKRIDDALKQGQLTLRDIARAYGLHPNNLSASLTKWRKRNNKGA